MAARSRKKARLLFDLFVRKMKLNDPKQLLPRVETLTKMKVRQVLVECLMAGLDTQKTTDHDNISQHLLKQCVNDLAVPLTTACFWENTRASVWKEVRVILVHKRSSISVPPNYCSVSLCGGESV